MDLNVKKTQAYVNHSLNGYGNANVAALRQNHYVSNPSLQKRISSYDVTYGQSPDIADHANAGLLLKTPVLRHIAMA